MKIDVLKTKEDAIIPTKGTEDSAGFDLFSCIERDVVINPGDIKLIDTGISIAIPRGCFGMICSRSGLSAKHGIITLNAPGIIDADYRGEVKCITMNVSDTSFTITNGMRIGQLIIMEYKYKAYLHEIKDEHEATTFRGTRGFGSTGY